MTTPHRPRSAVILAAGFGSRLRPLTDHRPKPLIEVGGVPIIVNALQSLTDIGVTQVSIVVGYRKDMIRSLCGQRFGEVDITYVESPFFRTTGTAYSLWLARETLLREDCYLLEGDVVFDADVLRRLQDDTAANVTGVVPFEATMEGSAVTLDRESYVSEILLGQTVGDLRHSVDLYKTLNLTRFSSASSHSVIVPALNAVASAEPKNVYLETILSRLVADGRLPLKAARCDGLRWYEIDSSVDLERAEALFASGIAPSHLRDSMPAARHGAERAR